MFAVAFVVHFVVVLGLTVFGSGRMNEQINNSSSEVSACVHERHQGTSFASV